MTESDIAAWLAVIGPSIGLILMAVKHYFKAREAKDLKGIINVISSFIEVAGDEFDHLWPQIEKLLDKKTANQIRKLASPKAVKVGTMNNLSMLGLKDTLDALLEKRDIGPKGKKKRKGK